MIQNVKGFIQSHAWINAGFIISFGFFSGHIAAADHSDTPLLIETARHDARIGDFYAFTRGQNLVLVMTIDPTIPAEATTYRFPSDVKYRFFIDQDSEVTFDNPDDVTRYGGTITKPSAIKEDIILEIQFDRSGKPNLENEGRIEVEGEMKFFSGLRDDPFIRGPLIGHQIAAMVIEMPLQAVLHNGQPTLLLWASTDVRNLHGKIEELGGRALRSQLPENNALNTLHPSKHVSELGVAPDVVIFNTALPAAFPNGRTLFDDVIDLVGDPRLLETDAPFPDANDIPFLDTFPYLPPIN